MGKNGEMELARYAGHLRHCMVYWSYFLFSGVYWAHLIFYQQFGTAAGHLYNGTPWLSYGRGYWLLALACGFRA